MLYFRGILLLISARELDTALYKPAILNVDASRNGVVWCQDQLVLTAWQLDRPVVLGRLGVETPCHTTTVA